MSQILLIARAELAFLLRDPQRWLLLLALPLFLIYVVGQGAEAFARDLPAYVRLDVIDQDQSPDSRAFLDHLASAQPVLLVCPTPADVHDACMLQGQTLTPALAQERLATQRSFGFLLIPPGFAAALAGGAETRLHITTADHAALPTALTLLVRQALLDRVGGRIVAELSIATALDLGLPLAAAAALPPNQQAGPGLRLQQAFSGDLRNVRLNANLLANGYGLSTPAIAAIFVMISIFTLVQGLTEERYAGVLWRLGTTPLTARQYVVGKWLAVCVYAWLLFAALLVAGALFGVRFGNALAAGLTALAYVLAVTSLAVAAATAARTPRQANSIATLAWVILSPLGGAWWPLELAPNWLRTLGWLSPVRPCLAAFHHLIFEAGTLAGILPSVLVLLLCAAIWLALGIRRFRFIEI